MNYREVLIRLIAITKPYVYDANISLLELTRKLYKIVNELCESLVEVTDEYKEFKDKIENDFESLREYVKDYFESLDVKQTVKDVLQEMTDDGTLEELLNQTVLVNINEHLNTIDSKILSLENNYSNLESTVSDIQSNVVDLTSRTGTLESDLAQEKSKIVTLEATSGNHESRIQAVTEQAESNTIDIEGLTERVSTAETDIQNTDNKIVNFEDYMTLTDYRSLTNPQITRGGGTISSNTMRIALNESGTVGKIYGRIQVNGVNNYPIIEFHNTGIMGITEEVIIESTGLSIALDSSANIRGILEAQIRIIPPTASETSATIQARIGAFYANGNCVVIYTPSLYFFKNFGDE